MSTNFIYSNFFSTSLAAPITSSGQTTITISSTTNAPAITAGQNWVIALNDAATQTIYEVLIATARTGNVLTVLRGQEGTAATTWLAGDNVYAPDTAGILNNFALVNGSTSQNFAAAALSAASIVALTTAVGTTPLTVSAIAGQTVDISDWTLTSGGTKAMWLTNLGALNIGSNSQGSTAGDIGISRNSTQGAMTLGGSSSFGIFDYGFHTAGSFTLTGNTSAAGNLILANNGTLLAGLINLNGNTQAVSSGDIAMGRAGATALMLMGTSSSAAGEFDFGIFNAAGFSFHANPTTPAYCPLYASAFTISSDRKFKTDIAPITYGLEAILALAPVSYTRIADEKKSLGFIAQEVELIIPEAVTVDNNGDRGLTFDGIIAALVLSQQQLAARVKALEPA